MIVFVVSPHPFSNSNVRVTIEEARGWISGGLDRLPETISSCELSKRHYICTALIYEFERSTDEDESTLIRHGRLQGREHLQAAGIWESLSR